MANVDIQLNRQYVTAGTSVSATGGPYTVAADGTISVDSTNEATVRAEIPSLLASPPGGISPLSGQFLRTFNLVDLSISTKQSLFTGPEGRTTVITAICVRNASGDPATATFAFGWNTPDSNNVADAAALLNGADPTIGAFAVIQAQFAVGAAGDVFGIKVGTANPSETISVDVQGYYI
jgi:hypothetical protein